MARNFDTFFSNATKLSVFGDCDQVTWVSMEERLIGQRVKSETTDCVGKIYNAQRNKLYNQGVYSITSVCLVKDIQTFHEKLKYNQIL